MSRNFAGPQVAIDSKNTINADVKPYLDALTAAVLDDPAVKAAGIKELVYTEGTRTWGRQNYLFVNQNEPGFNPAYSPDRPSDHQWGNAIDFGSGAGYRGHPVQVALHRLGPQFGWDFPIKNELWHGVCTPSNAAPLPQPTPPTKEEHMPLAVRATQSKFVSPGTKLLIEIGKSHSVSGATLDVYGFVDKPVDDKTLDLILRDHGIPRTKGAALDFNVANAIDTKQVGYLQKIATAVGTKLR